MKPAYRGGLASVAAACLLAACATRVAKVDHHVILQPGTVQHELNAFELFVMPMELEAPLPAFPVAYAKGDLAPMVVCAEVWLDANGDANRVAPLQQEPDCPARADARTMAFEQAVVVALQHWMWGPARICRFPANLREQMERGDCTGNEVDVVRVPVRLAYAFTFERSNGRVSVQASSSLPAATSNTTPSTRRKPRTGSQ
ncbi:MAG: hypothetical protein M3Y70_01815 [Pseudomonadota bacterium]|nr:hypothetical protein [Pseudomonadota bacterium]